MEHKKELIEIKNKKQRETECKKRKEKVHEKEIQKRKLEDAIRIQHDITPGHNKMII